MIPTAHHAILVDLMLPLRRPDLSIYVVEVGVASGHCSRYLLEHVPDICLLLVDNWAVPDHPTKKTQESCDQAYESAAELLRQWPRNAFGMWGDSVKAATIIDDEFMDLVFIDADHRYPAVRDDIAAWWPKVRPGGILCGHDYFSPRNGAGGWGVKQAVDEWSEQTGQVIEHRETVWMTRKA